MISCTYCNRIFSNNGGKATHEPYCKENENRQVRSKSPNAHARKGREPWNKGITKEQDIRMARPQFIGRRFASSLTGHTEETKKKLSDIAKKGNYGGYKMGSGRGKKGWYKGIFCDSSWELAYLLYCLDNNISIERCTERFEYIYNGKKLKYIPDFIIDGKFVEIKGYKSPQWLAKLEQCPIDLMVLYEIDMKPIIQFIIDKYGKDYIRLYEGK